MDYEWDEAKRRANLLKHGLDFMQVEEFEWPTAVVEEDRRQDYGERRLRAIGLIDARLHTLIFTMRRGRTRVISLRRSKAQEAAYYAAKSDTSDA